jgi:microcystin-dependent protein
MAQPYVGEIRMFAGNFARQVVGMFCEGLDCFDWFEYLETLETLFPSCLEKRPSWGGRTQ